MAIGDRSRRAFTAWFVCLPLFLQLGCGDSGDRSAEKRQKTVDCYNRFIFHRRLYVEHFNKLRRESDRGPRAVLLELCREDAHTLDPYHTPGVDPRLASAISEWKKAALEHIARLKEVDAGRGGAGAADEARKQFDAADERVKAVMNQIASELGGMEIKGE